MKFVLISLLVFVFVTSASANCHTHLQCYETKVNQLLNHQIKVELKGQYTYLYLANVFLKHDMYYPKVSEYFRKKANEELQHAERFIEYQNQRGGRFDITSVERKTGELCGNVASLKQGFACAKALEISVTHALTKLLNDVSNVTPVPIGCDTIDEDRRQLVLAQPVIVTHTVDGTESTVHLSGLDCQSELTITKVEYIELAEMINHEFLGHQMEDTKELANILATLNGFTQDEKLGSFLTDKHWDL